MKQRKKIGMNDVAFGDWRGDYGAFVTQLDASETRSWWGVGSSGGGGALPLGGPFFDRFARVWVDPANASAALTLKFDARLRGGLLLPAGGGEGAPANLSSRLLFPGTPPTPAPSASRLRMARSRGVRPSREWTSGLNKPHKPANTCQHQRLFPSPPTVRRSVGQDTRIPRRPARPLGFGLGV